MGQRKFENEGKVGYFNQNLGRRMGLGERDAPDEDWKQLEQSEQFLRGQGHPCVCRMHVEVRKAGHDISLHSF